MFAFHKPKTYRSACGCCICGAKSSSSRFTDSSRYEHDFERCFNIKEERCGEICNACVLLVKRWKKLPPGSNRNWNHVVDARAGPGSKAFRAKTAKNKVEVEVFKKIRKKKIKSAKRTVKETIPFDLLFEDNSNTQSSNLTRGIRTRSMVPPSPSPSNSSEEDADEDDIDDTPRQSPFIDLRYWTETKVCCGVVFKGQNGELMIDIALFKPCAQCKGNANNSPALQQEELSNDMEYSSSYKLTTRDSTSFFHDERHYETQPPTPTSPLDLRLYKRDYAVQGMPCVVTEL